MINFSRGMLQAFKERLQGRGSGPQPERRRAENAAALRELEERRSRLNQKFRPPEEEWLLFGLLLAALNLCLAWAWLLLLGLSDFANVAPGDDWARLFLLAPVYLAGFYRGRTLGERERPDLSGVTLIKLAVLALLARFGPYLANPAALGNDLPGWFGNAANFFSLPAGIFLFMLLWSYFGAEGQGRRALNFYVRPDEILVEEGGGATGSTVWVDRQQSYRSFKQQLVVGGFLLGLSVALLALITANSASQAAGQAGILCLVYVALALLTVALARYRYLRAIWRLSELSVPERLPRRWAWYGLAVAGLAALFALLMPRTANLDLSQTNLNVLKQPTNTGEGQQPLPQLRPEPPREPPTPPLQLPDWLLPLFQFLVMAGLVLFLIWLVWNSGVLEGLRVRLKLPRLEPGRWLSELGRTLRALLASLLSLFRRGRAAPGEQVEDGPEIGRGWFRRFWRESEPDDPRERVRYHYRQTLRKAGRRGLPRKPAQTPHEYAAELEDRLAATPALPEDPRPAVENLSAGYEEARFSPHPISPEQAAAAAEQAARLQAALRKARRQKD